MISADPHSSKPGVVRDFLSRREFTFTMENDIYIRYLSFKDKDDMRKHIMAKQPHKIDIGAVFSAPVCAALFRRPQRTSHHQCIRAAIQAHDNEEGGVFHGGARVGV